MQWISATVLIKPGLFWTQMSKCLPFRWPPSSGPWPPECKTEQAQKSAESWTLTVFV